MTAEPDGAGRGSAVVENGGGRQMVAAASRGPGRVDRVPAAGSSPLVRRLLLLVVAAEVVFAGWAVGRRAQSVAPALPAATTDDPLIGPEFAALAERATAGGADAWQALGEAILGQGAYRHAERAFARAAELDPESGDALFGRALCLDRTGEIAESNLLYRRCLEFPEQQGENAGRSERALYAIGRNLLRLGDLAGAEAAFRENGSFVAARFQLAKLLFHDGRSGEAVRIVDHLLGQLPLALELHQLKAAILEAAELPREAFRARVMEERSAHLIESNFNTDQVRPFVQRHGLPGALAEIESLLPPVPGDPARDPGRLAERTRHLDSLLGQARIPQRLTLAYLTAALSDGRDELGRSLVLVDALGDRGPTRLDLEATVRELAGDEAGALALRERAVAMAPSARLHGLLATAYEQGADPARARFHRARHHFHLGKDAYRRNQLAEAARELRRAVAIDETHVAAWYHLGEVAYHLGRSGSATEQAAAAAAFRRVVELEPDHEPAADFLRYLVADPS